MHNKLQIIQKVLKESKATDILYIDLKNKASFADHMIIASGTSSAQIKAIATKVAKELKKAKQKVLNIEGIAQADWVLLDANEVILHLFKPEVRDFYQIEKIWC